MIEIVTDMCGLFTVIWGEVNCIHFFIREKGQWTWGYEEDWYDGPIHTFGLGPLFLIVWQNWK